jgi:hypothetical protein
MENISFVATVFTNEIKQIFDGFISEGFSFQETKITNTSAIGDYVELSLLNRNINRKILFSYIPSHDSRPDTVSVFIENCAGDSFSLDEYLVFIKAPLETTASLILENYKGEVQERIFGCIVASKKVIDRYLLPVIHGNEWQHVPIDWGDYK